MASLEQRGNRFRVIFRLGGEKHRVSVNSPDKKDAEACLVRLEENLRLVERGRLTIPDGADVGLFLLSDGRLEQRVKVVRPVRLEEMFETYRTDFTAGAKEAITREMENIHLNHLSRLIGGDTPVASVTAGIVQQFVDARSKDLHLGHPVKPKTVRKAVVRALIDQARDATARAVNSALVQLYWCVGDRIRRDILKEKRADYGKQIVGALSRELGAAYGKGFTDDNLFRMIQFAEVFPDREIVGTLSRQLGWSHFLLLLPVKDGLKREFYAEMCRVERWSVRTLREKVGGMLYERTALSKKPAELAKQELAKLRAADQLSPDLVFRDPYFLDFLGLKDTYSEKDLEAGILREIEAFLLELGGGFTFVARQKRMVIDGEDFALDLLFYHRKLRRLTTDPAGPRRRAPASSPSGRGSGGRSG